MDSTVNYFAFANDREIVLLTGMVKNCSKGPALSACPVIVVAVVADVLSLNLFVFGANLVVRCLIYSFFYTSCRH